MFWRMMRGPLVAFVAMLATAGLSIMVVRSLVQAEFPEGISCLRNSDPSVPPLMGDTEQLIQAVLNVVRNAAQALLSEANRGKGGVIVLRTRAARQVTLVRRRHKLGNSRGLASSARAQHKRRQRTVRWARPLDDPLPGSWNP